MEKKEILDVSEIGADKAKAIRVILLKSKTEYFVVVDHSLNEDHWTEKAFKTNEEATSYYKYAVNEIACGMDLSE